MVRESGLVGGTQSIYSRVSYNKHLCMQRLHCQDWDDLRSGSYAGYRFSKCLVFPPLLARLVSVPPQSPLGIILAAFLHLIGGGREREKDTKLGVFTTQSLF